METAGGYGDRALSHTDTGARPVRPHSEVVLSRSLSTGLGLSLLVYSCSSSREVRGTHLLLWTICSVAISPTPFASDPCQFSLTHLL